MDTIGTQYLLELWKMNICPQCGIFIRDGTRVGTGRKSDGGFCSLDCYVKFYALELIERDESLKRLIEHVRNN